MDVAPRTSLWVLVVRVMRLESLEVGYSRWRFLRFSFLGYRKCASRSRRVTSLQVEPHRFALSIFSSILFAMNEPSDNLENTRDSQLADVVGKTRTVRKPVSHSVKTRAQAKRQPKWLSDETMPIDFGQPSDFRRSLWKDDCSEPKSKQSACASIIDKYRIDFEGKESSQIPLCRL
ncbi:hypothetical protein R1sor_016090 [Riccia sorocarpa]|uniref:Uncharacterized protein n=1 Tax=Riccia sorocarpa TaxID=122646 RepID=A0ABD3HG05_9MARC